MQIQNEFGPHSWAVILGGSSGFGLATAKKLAAHGMNLCLVHRDRRSSMTAVEAEFDAVRSTGVRVLAFNTDATNPEECRNVVGDLTASIRPNGSVRVLLHSIAFGNLKPLVGDGDANNALREDDFAHTIHAMGISVVTWTQALLSAGVLDPEARVLSMTSEGNSVAWKGYAAVSAAKAALEAVSRSMAVELAPFGVRTNVIQAGVTDTPALRMIPGSDGLKHGAIQRNPFRRLTTPQDVAGVVYLLCRNEASWINGALIRVDGGEHIAGV